MEELISKYDAWKVQVIDNTTLGVSTWMDNFPMADFLFHLGVKREDIDDSDDENDSLFNLPWEKKNEDS